MFPDRVRAVTIDGVWDPVAYAGTSATASRPQGDRVRSADGASKALLEILRLCDRAGEQKCRFAAGDPVGNYDRLATRLNKTPLVLEGPPAKGLVSTPTRLWPPSRWSSSEGCGRLGSRTSTTPSLTS